MLKGLRLGRSGWTGQYRTERGNTSNALGHWQWIFVGCGPQRRRDRWWADDAVDCLQMLGCSVSTSLRGCTSCRCRCNPSNCPTVQLSNCQLSVVAFTLALDSKHDTFLMQITNIAVYSASHWLVPIHLTDFECNYSEYARIVFDVILRLSDSHNIYYIMH